MGTRLFCDHCGNTVQKFTVLSYGGLIEKIEAEQQYVHNMQMQIQLIKQYGGGNGGIAAGPSQPAKLHTPIVNVELCERCVPIWMKRVEMLCKQSDTDNV